MSFHVRVICFASGTGEYTDGLLRRAPALLQYYNVYVSRDVGTESKLFPMVEARDASPPPLREAPRHMSPATLGTTTER